MYTILQKISIFIIYMISSFIMGLDLGNITVVSTESDNDKAISDMKYQIIFSYCWGALSGALITLFMGRKMSLIMGNLAVILGSGVIICKKEGDKTLLMSRFLVGVGVSIYTVVSPLIVSEISSVKRRAALISVWGVIFNCGLFLSNAVSDLLLAFMDWKWILASPIVPSVFEILLVIITSKDALDGVGNYLETPSKLSLFKALAAASTVQLSSCVSGYKNVLMMAPKHVSFSVLAGVAFMGSIFSIFVNHCCPRKFMLSVSIPVLVLILAGLILIDPTSSCVPVLVLIYIFIYSTFLATIGIVYTIEIFPTDFKPLGCALTGIMNWIFSLIINYVIKHGKISEKEQMATFAVISAAILLIFIPFLPESKKESESGETVEITGKDIVPDNAGV